MPLHPGKYFLFLLCVIVGAMLFNVGSARGCSCLPRTTVLDAFEKSEVVIIARLISVEKVGPTAVREEPTNDGEQDSAEEQEEQEERVQQYVNGIRSATMVVEKVFKGSLKIRDEIVFGQGGGGDCIWTFEEKSVGEQFLLYLHPPKPEVGVDPIEGPVLWFAGFCGRSAPLEWATEDLLYLENMDKLRGKTRISGLIGTWRDSNLQVEGKKIRLIGPKKTYEIKTGKHGVFEIYDLPPGKYSIQPEVPPGWAINKTWMRRSNAFKDDQGPGVAVVVLEPKKHVRVDFILEIDNAVRGVVYDPNRKPMKGVCVSLQPEGNPQERGFNSDCSEDDGRFAIKSISSGSYVVVINDNDKLSSAEPFRRFFYPGVSEREKALVITIGPGDQVNDLNIVVPALVETIMVEGMLRYSDGAPAAKKHVRFTAEDTATTYGSAHDETDAAGRFSFRLLKGVKGEIASEEYVYPDKFENCPKIDELVKKSGGDSLVIKTNVIALQAEEHTYGLELVYPFTRCKEKK